MGLSVCLGFFLNVQISACLRMKTTKFRGEGVWCFTEKGTQFQASNLKMYEFQDENHGF